MPYGNDVRSPVEIVEDVLRDVGDIVRAEVQLGKAEIREEAQKAGKAAGMFGGAAVCGLLGAACLTATVVAALALAMPVWLAALLTAVFLGCIAGAFYAGAQAKFKSVQPVPRRTVDTLKEDLEWAKHRMT